MAPSVCCYPCCYARPRLTWGCCTCSCPASPGEGEPGSRSCPHGDAGTSPAEKRNTRIQHKERKTDQKRARKGQAMRIWGGRRAGSCSPSETHLVPAEVRGRLRDLHVSHPYRPNNGEMSQLGSDSSKQNARAPAEAHYRENEYAEMIYAIHGGILLLQKEEWKRRKVSTK